MNKIINRFEFFFCILLIISCSSNDLINSDSGDLVIEDCFGVANGTAVEDVCGVCEGDGSTCQNLWTIHYSSLQAIGGFQFEIRNATINDTAGGDASAAGFTISFNSATGKILAFSFSGVSIPAGEGILLALDISGSDPCIDNPIFSGPSANPLEATVENCNSINIE